MSISRVVFLCAYFAVNSVTAVPLNSDLISEDIPSLISNGSNIVSSITFWDIDNANYPDSEKARTKEEVIRAIMTNDTVVLCDVRKCEKKLYPMICDNTGVVHTNVCRFKCSQRTNRAIKPTMVFTETEPLKKCRQLCQKQFGGSSA